MLLLTDKKIKFIFYVSIFIFLTTQNAIKKNDDKNLITKVNHIKVTGLSQKNNLQVSESLNTLLFKNIFFINKDDFNEILQKNNLIESFDIKKIYPNRINVKLKKTNFLAITTKDNKKYYIGSNGKLISFDNSSNFKKKLPFVFSKHNYENFIKLKKIIDKSKFNFEEIESFYYFLGNRWDLKTKDGLLIKLPEKKILDSLQTAYLIKSNKNFEKNKIIDLRVSNTLIISNE